MFEKTTTGLRYLRSLQNAQRVRRRTENKTGKGKKIGLLAKAARTTNPGQEQRQVQVKVKDKSRSRTGLCFVQNFYNAQFI